MEASASGTSVATDLTAVATGGATVDSESASASIHKNTAVIASVYSESDPIAKYNAVLCVLAPDDPSTDVDSDRIAVRRINTIAQDESGILKYYPTTMQADTVGTEPPITVDNILGKCTYESKELYSYVKFVNSVPGILLLMVLPAVILVVMLIVAIVRANTKSDDDSLLRKIMTRSSAKIPTIRCRLQRRRAWRTFAAVPSGGCFLQPFFRTAPFLHRPEL